MFITGIIFCIIIAIIIILLVTSRNNKKEDIQAKKVFAIPPQKKYPLMYFKDCRFYAEAVSRFEYSEEEVSQFLSSLDECFEKEDYAKAIKLSNEVIKIMPKSDKVWTKRIASVFIDVITNEKCWNEKLSRVILNSCYGFLQCFETVVDKSIAVKHILLPLLMKSVEELIKYQNKNVTKHHNLEVYNMLLNLYNILPYQDILILLSNNILEDKSDKDFESEPYVSQTLKSLLKHVDMFRTKNTSRLQETFDSKLITNCTLITDERIGANIIAFELTFNEGVKSQKIEATFFDENGEELQFGNSLEDRYVDVFENSSDRKVTTKQEMVILTEEHIDKVVLKIYKEKNVENDEENKNEENEEKELEKNNTQETSKENNTQEFEDFEPAVPKFKPQMLMYPAFSGITEIGLSDTRFVGLKENKTVITLGIGDKLKQQTNTWENINKIYVKNDAVYGVREDGTVIYAGECEYEGAEYLYSWANVESLSLGEKHMVAITKNATMYALGANSNGECNIDEWYDIIQVSTAYHTVGVCKNGKVLATGENNFGECDVSAWQDIIQVATGDFYTLGLTSSGKVLAAGLNSCGQCNVSDWANIKKIYAKGNMSVGVRYDGKVVTAGKNSYHYGDIKNWSRIKDIVMSSNRIIGIEQDGTVRATGKPYRNFVNGDWKDVKNVVINSNNILAIKENGTLLSNDLVFGYCISDNFDNVVQICEDIDNNRVVLVSDNGVVTINNKNLGNKSDNIYPTFYDVKKVDLSETHLVMLKNNGTAGYYRFSDGVSEDILAWDNLIDVDAGKDFLIGLNISGKVMAMGKNSHGQCDVSEWHDIVKIRAAGKRAIGLSIDGKLYMSGISEYGEDDFIKLFKNVKDFALTNLQTMILESDGTVKVTYHPDGVNTEGVKVWKNIKKVVARGNNFLCLAENGKVYSTIDNEAEIGGWEEVEDIEASGSYVWATLKS